MEIFVTGATGYVGSAVCRTLLSKGFEVSGLARSEEASASLQAAGVKPVPGDLSTPQVLAAAARKADGTIHTAMQWVPDAAELDRSVVSTLIDALSGSNKPLIYTSAVWVMGETKGRVAGEMFPLQPPPAVAWRPAVEQMVRDSKEKGVCGVVLRPALVYGRGGGLLGSLLKEAREQGVVRVPGTGENHWSFVFIDDLAAMYHLALEKAQAGSLYLAAHGNAVTAKAVAEMAAKCTGVAGKVEWLPVEKARETMGPMADCLVMDQQILSTKAARELGWKPAGPGVLQAIAAGTA
jgi:nucleoside-diphosphate-sugar epimerase